MMNIVFMIPGYTFSSEWVNSFSHTLAWCTAQRINWAWKTCRSNNIYQVRNLALEPDWNGGQRQKVFGKSNIDYDYLMWLDSDQVWTPYDVAALLKHKDKPIVGGWYSMQIDADCPFVRACCGRWNKDPQYFTGKEMAEMPVDKDGLIDVDYNGFGFMLIQKGVFESLDYPWFTPEWNEGIEKKVGMKWDVIPDDAAFCIKAQEGGYRILVDPEIRVGHQKPAIM